jgi:type I restriction enzyme S subunit
MKDTPFTEARLLSLYDRVVEAEDAIPRLRRFVLNLAVRGKLVPPDEADEPASALLDRIVQITRARIRAGDFREPKSFLETRRTDLPFTPPSTWAWVRLIELCEVSYGFAFNSARFNSERKGNPLIRIRDISRQDTEAYFDGPFDSFYVVKNGDYLVGMDGDFNVRKWAGVDALLNQRVMRMRNWSPEVLAGFVALPLQEILNHLHGETSLTTVKHLSAKQINGVEIPLPPLAEQHRIVAKVEALMALLDRLEAARAAREETRTRLTTATLSRLTEADADTPAAAPFALQTIPALTTRPDQIKALRQTILNLAVRGKLSQSSGAILRKVGDLRTLQNGYAFKSEWFTKDGVRLLRNANVGHGEVSWSDEVRLPESRTDEFGRFALNEGDIVLTLDRPFIVTGTKVARLKAADLPCLLLQRVGRFIQTAPGLSDDYLFLWINSPHFNEQIDPGRSNGVPHISSKQVEAAEIWVPSLIEQHRIVTKVEELMSLCDRLERALQDATTTRARLLDATLRDALTDAQEAA